MLKFQKAFFAVLKIHSFLRYTFLAAVRKASYWLLTSLLVRLNSSTWEIVRQLTWKLLL